MGTRMPARAWPTRRRGSGCISQLGVRETRPGLPACCGPIPAAPTHFRVGLTIHGADGRFQHPVLGPRAPSRGRCAGRDPRRGSSRSPAERRVLLPVRRVHRGLCVSTSETEDAPSAPPGQARSSINVPQNRREEHTDPRTGQATWAGQVPDERAGRHLLSPSSLRRGGEASAVPVLPEEGWEASAVPVLPEEGRGGVRCHLPPRGGAGGVRCPRPPRGGAGGIRCHLPPRGGAGRRPLSPSSPRRGGEASSVSVTRTSPSRPPSQDPRLMPL